MPRLQVERLESWQRPSRPNDPADRLAGWLLKGGEPDKNAVARMVLNDWQRGKLPFFVAHVNPDAAKVEEKPEPLLKSREKRLKKNEGDDVQPFEAQPDFMEDSSSDEAEDDEDAEENVANDKATEE